MSDKKISQLPVGALTPLSIFPIVTDGITSKIAFYDILNQVSEMDKFLTGGTYDNGTTTFTNNKGDVFDVTGYFTGNTDVYITGGTYSGGITTLTNSIGDSFDITGYTIDTKLLITGATNYIAKFDSTGLTESQIIDDGIDVDIANGNFKFEKSGYASSYPLIVFGKNVANSFYMNAQDTGSFQIRRTGSMFGPLIRMGSSWGPISAQTPSTTNQSLGGISFEAYTGPGTGTNGYTSAASIGAGASASASTGNSSAHMTFKTTPTGSTTSLERMRLTDDGSLLINTTINTGSTTDKLQVSGSANISLDSKIRNVNIGRGTNSGNLLFGFESLTGATSAGTLNHAIGDYALTNTTSGHDNISIGYASLNKNTSGYENSSIGIYSLYYNTTGTYNVALGNSALQSNRTGTQNMSIGAYSLTSSSGGSYNTAIGVSALQNAFNSDRNVAIGNSALYYLTTGSFNTAIGTSAMFGSNTLAITGNYNIGIGFQAARAITTGSNNIMIECNLNDGITTGSNNIILDPVNRCGISVGSGNVVIGGFNSSISSASTNSLYFGTGGGTMRFQFDSAGTMSITSTPLSGTYTDKILVRTSAGQIKQIDSSSMLIGTANSIPKFNSGGTGVISSSIYEGAIGKISIGTTAPIKDLTFDGNADREITTYKTDYNTNTSSMYLSSQSATGDYTLGFVPLDGIGSSRVQFCNSKGDVYCIIGNNLAILPYGVGPVVLVQGVPGNSTNYVTCATINKTNSDIYVALDSGDIYKQSGETGTWTALGQTPRSWAAMSVAPNGNIYACDSNDVYLQSGGTGNFVALSAGTGGSSITVALNGDVYLGKAPTGIYKQTGGIGAFVLYANDTNATRVAALTTAPNGDIWAACNSNRRMSVLYAGASAFVAIGNVGTWSNVAVHNNGDVYASYPGFNAILKVGSSVFVDTTIKFTTPIAPAIAPNGDIWITNNAPNISYLKAGTKTPIIITTPNYPSAITVAPNGDVYYSISNGDIYRATGGTTNFVALGQTVRTWSGLAYAPNGDIYAVTNGAGGDIYKATGGTGNFIAQGKTSVSWNSISIHPLNGDIYTTTSAPPYDLYITSGAGQPTRQNLSGLTGQLLGVVVDSYGDVFVTRWQGVGLFKVSGTSMTAVNALGGYGVDAYYGIGHMNGTLVTVSYSQYYAQIRPRKNASGGITKIKGGMGFGTGSSRVQIITGVKTSDGGVLQTTEQVVAEFDENKNATIYGTATISGALIGSNASKNNLFFGPGALNPTYSGDVGNYNMAIGTYALSRQTGATQNTAIGAFSLFYNSSGQYNLGLGSSTLMFNTTGSSNTAIGASAMYTNTFGQSNIGIGVSALQGNTTGSYNLSIGVSSMLSNKTGNYNIALGYQAGRLLTSGNNNLLIEVSSGNSVTTGSNNIILNPINASGIVTGNNNVIIGGFNNTIPDGSNRIFIGDGIGNTRVIIDSTGATTFNGTVTSTQFRISALNIAPASATDIGTIGEIRIVNGFIYVCVATNTWQRTALTTW